MTHEQYWYGDVWMVEGFREADKLKRQRKSEELWMAGLYNHNAVAVAVSNAFRKKGTAPQKYLEEAIRVVPYTKVEKEMIAKRERQKTIDYFNRLAKKWEQGTDSGG